jgi:hypothetical protein
MAGPARRNGINSKEYRLSIKRNDPRLNGAEMNEMFYAVVPCRASAVATAPNFARSFYYFIYERMKI